MQRKHHQLKTWQKSIELVSHVYEITKNFPKHEIYALTIQIRKSAISVPSNIAEGAARKTSNEFLNFLSIARGSLSELETQLIISRRLGYMDKNYDIEEKLEEVFGLLGGLINSVNSKGS